MEVLSEGKEEVVRSVWRFIVWTVRNIHNWEEHLLWLKRILHLITTKHVDVIIQIIERKQLIFGLFWVFFLMIQKLFDLNDQN